MHVSGLSSPLTGLGRQLHPASPKRSPTAKKHFAAGPLLSNVKSVRPFNALSLLFGNFKPLPPHSQPEAAKQSPLEFISQFSTH